jgi:hypothetical protein
MACSGWVYIARPWPYKVSFSSSCALAPRLEVVFLPAPLSSSRLLAFKRLRCVSLPRCWLLLALCRL